MRVFSPVARLKTSSGFATIFGGVVIPRNGSNPARANAHKLATVWAPRFSPYRLLITWPALHFLPQLIHFA